MVGYFSTGEDRSAKDSKYAKDSKDSNSNETNSKDSDSPAPTKMEKLDVEMKGTSFTAPFLIFMNIPTRNTLSQRQRVSIFILLFPVINLMVKKVINGITFTVVEVLVSAVALAYGMFLVMVYSKLSDPLKMFWRLIVHPVYFEVGRERRDATNNN
jgi:hypothetical protein